MHNFCSCLAAAMHAQFQLVLDGDSKFQLALDGGTKFQLVLGKLQKKNIQFLAKILPKYTD